MLEALSLDLCREDAYKPLERELVFDIASTPAQLQFGSRIGSPGVRKKFCAGNVVNSLQGLRRQQEKS